MAVMDLPRAVRFAGCIQAKHDGGDFGPVGTFRCGVKYP